MNTIKVNLVPSSAIEPFLQQFLLLFSNKHKICFVFECVWNLVCPWARQIQLRSNRESLLPETVSVVYQEHIARGTLLLLDHIRRRRRLDRLQYRCNYRFQLGIVQSVMIWFFLLFCRDLSLQSSWSFLVVTFTLSCSIFLTL